MSNGANLSIMGLHNADPTVLDMMVFPDGFTDEQKRITKENILIECAELEFLYPNPFVAKPIIGIWSSKEKPYWQRVYNASLLEYNPIENYRRNESETIEDGKTEEHSGTDSTARTGTETLRHEADRETVVDETNVDRQSGSDTTSGSSTSSDTNSGTDTETNSVTGYDSNAFVGHDKSEIAHGHVLQNQASGTNTQTYGKIDSIDHDSTVTESHDDTDTTTHNTTDTLHHGEKIEHEGSMNRNVLAYGNIGVTTSQDMLTQEMEVAKIINVIPIIIESFKNRFCLMVY